VCVYTIYIHICTICTYIAAIWPRPPADGLRCAGSGVSGRGVRVLQTTYTVFFFLNIFFTSRVRLVSAFRERVGRARPREMCAQMIIRRRVGCDLGLATQ